MKEQVLSGFGHEAAMLVLFQCGLFGCKDGGVTVLRVTIRLLQSSVSIGQHGLEAAFKKRKKICQSDI